MKANYLIAGMIVVALAIGGYVFITSSAASKAMGVSANQVPAVTTLTEMPKSNPIIEYTNAGFSPKSITVKVGTTVTWENKNSNPLWVASAPHPQHTDLPGFDALKAYNMGETYAYTFVKVGNWKYHNHLMPKDFGVVNVTE